MFDNILNILFGNNYKRRSRNYNSNFIYKLITFEKAKDMIENSQAVLIDVRSNSEYDLMHIKNAVNIPVDEIEKRIFVYEQVQPFIIYCSSGSRSKTAVQILNSLGYTNIYIWEYASLATFPYKNMLSYSENVRGGI